MKEDADDDALPTARGGTTVKEGEEVDLGPALALPWCTASESAPIPNASASPCDVITEDVAGATPRSGTGAANGECAPPVADPVSLIDDDASDSEFFLLL